MRKTTFHRFLLTKSEEEAGEEQLPSSSFSTEVQIRPNPKTLELFPWNIRKVLTLDDVGFFGGLQLTPEEAHTHILCHWDHDLVTLLDHYEERLPILVHDLDTDTKHTLFIKKWPDEDNYTLHRFWIEEFVKRRELKEGVVVGMYWDVKSWCLCFSVIES